ncbi:MAG TPA: hypothetical protein VIJ27_04585 [Mucilaginibacter sp.]
MNLADYLSELLGQHDEVSIPGLGYFVRVRINAYYNDKEAKFHPPHHQVKFVPQPKDDDTFVQYVADKKNISLASSKYFAEKFISKLKEEAAKGKYLFADLGIFYTEQGQLVFKPNEKITADKAFYGYPQVNAHRLGQPLSPGDARPAFAKTFLSPPAFVAPVQTIEDQQYIDEETERKRPVNVWLIILIGLTAIALALFGIYKFYPLAFNKITEGYHNISGKKEDTTVTIYRKEITVDTVKKTSAADTSVKTNVPATISADTVKRSAWAVILGDYDNPQLADVAVKYYKNRGLNAKSLNLSEIPGPRIKVSGGIFLDQNEADSLKLLWIQQKKILSSSYVTKINPQQ